MPVEMPRLKALEDEDSQLKMIVADLTLKASLYVHEIQNSRAGFLLKDGSEKYARPACNMDFAGCMFTCAVTDG